MRLVLEDRLMPGPVVENDLELECGHHVDLGPESSAAVVAVCLLRHWESCRVETPWAPNPPTAAGALVFPQRVLAR